MENFNIKKYLAESILLKEDTQIDNNGQLIYSLYDENSDWDFSDDENFQITWQLDYDVPNKKVQKRFDWDDEDFSIEIPIKDIKEFLNNPTETTKNFEVPNGYIPMTKKDAYDIIDSFHENWPEDVNPELN